MGSLWTIDEIDLLLVTELLPFSYRRTILDWIRKKYCIHMWNNEAINLRHCKRFNNKANGIPEDIRTIAIIAEFEMFIEKAVKSLVLQYNIIDKQTTLNLENCLN